MQLGRAGRCAVLLTAALGGCASARSPTDAGLADADVHVGDCVSGTDDCDREAGATCTSELGSFTCACPAGFAGTGHGANGCLWDDPSLTSLVPSAGALAPVFAGATTMYTLALPEAVTGVSFTPSVAAPALATITVQGMRLGSGVSSAPVAVSLFAPVVAAVTVTAESGATRTYTVVVTRAGASTYIKASNTGELDVFGQVVALSADGRTLAVGVPLEDSTATGVDGDQADDSALKSGAVYVFRQARGAWAQEAYIKASNTEAGDDFGFSVSISADGTTLAVGARSEDSAATGVGGDQADNNAPWAGAVYIFARTDETWAQRAYVKASNTGTGDDFGAAVALSADGSMLAVGAPGESSAATGVGGDQVNDSASGSGAVYCFTRAGDTWTQDAYIKASNTNGIDALGVSVALSSDGSLLAVGAPGESSAATGVGGDQADNSALVSGAVYVYARRGGAWIQEAYVKASNTDEGDNFGLALALSSDGSTIAVATNKEDSAARDIDGDRADNSARNSGAVYVFTRIAGTWMQDAYVKASNTDAGDEFGVAVALSADGSMLAVGADNEDSAARGIGGDPADNSAITSGAVYVLTRAGGVWAHAAYVKASNTDVGDQFGHAVSMSSDGATLAVGAWFEGSAATGVGGDQADRSVFGAGAVYVF